MPSVLSGASRSTGAAGSADAGSDALAERVDADVRHLHGAFSHPLRGQGLTLVTACRGTCGCGEGVFLSSLAAGGVRFLSKKNVL